MHHPDICIAGAGVIGLSLALELHHRGARVTVLDQGTPLAEASTAAAGMLAGSDPDNPPQLGPLAELSLALYPAFLERLRELSGVRVPFQTSATLQSLPPHASATRALTGAEVHRLVPNLVFGDHRFLLLDESSLDPLELAAALLAAVRAAAIDLRSNTKVLTVRSVGDAVEVETSTETVRAAQFVDCTGAWASATSSLPRFRVTPKKGQMLLVSLAPTCPLRVVVRTPDIYIVPRISGPNAGRAIVGATIEDAGFDKTVHASDIARLRALATALLPDVADAPEVEAWAGLRPATPDGLPLLGGVPGQRNHFLATGHYRNGILLAPATAWVMAQSLMGEDTTVDMTHFSPSRMWEREK